MTLSNQTPQRPPSVPFEPRTEAAEILAELARSLRAEGNFAEAVEAFEQALALNERRADLLAELGNLWQDLNRPELALDCYQKSLAVDPDYIPARQNLGYLLFNSGDPLQAIVHYEHARAIRPTGITEMLAATVLPVVYESIEDVRRWRERFCSRVAQLADEGLRVETSYSQIPTNFFLAYQGENDRDINAKLGQIYQGVELCEAAKNKVLDVRNRRLRVGFLSSYFHDHTIGRLNLGRIRHLSREHLEVTVLYAAQSDDSMARAFQAAADHYVVIPRIVDLARQMIAQQELDVLVFTDVGMDSITSTLVYSRMAPIQCATWGHPVTTGSPAIDYYISCELTEGADAPSHYTETLVQLPYLGVYYDRPDVPRQLRPRSYFGLESGRHIYLCPQTPYKFHPDFDAVLAGILDADPLGDVVLLEGRMPNWTTQLKQRFARTIPDVERRIRFLPSQPMDEFLSLLAAADVMLDPLHFSGGNTSYEALAMGTPIVTLPSPYFRGRMTLGLYRKMNVPDMVAESTEDYVKLAVKLGTDANYRSQMSERIRSASSVLFEDEREVRALEEFFLSLGRTAHASR